MKSHVGIIIPSYNELDNLRILLKKIRTYLPQATIVIVDDSNPLENSKLEHYILGQKYPVILLSRFSKLGRGSAVMAGLREIVKNKSITCFFEMDADLAHDPKDFATFLRKMDLKKADLVVGSRYLTQSKIVHWPLRRLILSKLINWFINCFLGLHLTDYTNGFRLYSQRAVIYLTRSKLNETGFIALSEIAYKLKTKNYILTEVPITFTDRKFGASSATIHEFYRSLVGLIKLRLFK